MTDPCIVCNRPTAGPLPGTKILIGINRVPSDNGYMCEMCAGYECDVCGNQIAVDTEVRCADHHNYHTECYVPSRHGPAEYGDE